MLLSFSLGLACANLYPYLTTYWLPGFMGCGLACIPIFFLPARWKHRLRFATGALLFLLFLSAGGLHMALKSNTPHNPATNPGIKTPWVLTVISAPVYTRSGIRFEARIAQRSQGSALQFLKGHCIVYLRDSLMKPYMPGSRWVIRTGPVPILKSSNPGAPDYRGYLQTRGILYQVFLQPSELVMAGNSPCTDLAGNLEKQKAELLAILQHHLRDPQVLGLAEAILLGSKMHLDPAITSAFSKTGVMHVIAISGMHLSLIFTLLMAMFRFVPAGRYRLLVSLLIALPAIWWFSLLTGGSASAIRSAIMCTLPVTGLAFSRRILNLNNLSASALLMLFYEPHWIRDPGFQLSFAALLGILVWQSGIHGWLRFSNPALKACWNLVSVTLAAQIFTTPLVLFYFHQFPLLFLFANICAVPLSSLALVTEILLCFCAFSETLSAPLAFLVDGLLRMLLHSVDGFSQIPGSVIKPVYLDLSNVLCITLNVLLLKSWLVSRKPRRLLVFLASILVSTISVFHSGWMSHSQHWVAILQQRNASILAHVRGRSARVYLADLQSNDLHNPALPVAQLIQFFRIRDHKLVPLQADQLSIIKTGTVEIMMARSPYPPSLPHPHHPFRILVLCQGAGSNLQDWLKVIGCKQVVVDGSHPLWKIQGWEKEAEKLPLPLHLTPRDGAFLLDCNNPNRYAKKN
jgi:competence protein ComEC